MTELVDLFALFAILMRLFVKLSGPFLLVCSLSEQLSSVSESLVHVSRSTSLQIDILTLPTVAMWVMATTDRTTMG